MARILIVDDEEKMRHLIALMLSRHGHRVEHAGDGLEAFRYLQETPCDLVISDIKMPKMDGIALLEKLKAHDIACPLVYITAFATIDSAVDAMRCGALDYITKPFEEERILLTVERALNFSRIMAENRELKQELKQAAGGDDIVYVSKSMSALMDLVRRVAQSDSAVLISGESGTGKELLAQYIHRASPRGEKRFVPVNCAAISPNLVESELFGHDKGAFTGADRRTQGKFEFAAGGTIFLDEIGDLPMEAQAKLLRALQEKRIQRVGGNEEIPVDVRVICATNQDLPALVQSGRFRQDLFYRIDVFPIQPPPLRERMEDVVPLAEHFLRRMAGGSPVTLTPEAAGLLNAYRWPGNVRELANAMERSVILAGDRGKITPETLSFLRSALAADSCFDGWRLPAGGIRLAEVERDLVRQALEAAGSNQTRAAELLGLSRAKFRVLLKQARRHERA